MESKSVIYMELDKMIPNPDNPRFIRDEKYQILLRSITESPSYMELRPIILDKHGVIQGGNMRYKACNELGWKEAPYDVYTEERYQRDCEARKKQAKKENKKYVEPTYEDCMREFVIKDNLGYGEFDPIMMDENFTFEELKHWGYDVVEVEEINLDNFFEEVNDTPKETKNRIVLEYSEEEYELVNAKFQELGGSKEQVVWRLLGLNEER